MITLGEFLVTEEGTILLGAIFLLLAVVLGYAISRTVTIAEIRRLTFELGREKERHASVMRALAINTRHLNTEKDCVSELVQNLCAVNDMCKEAQELLHCSLTAPLLQAVESDEKAKIYLSRYRPDLPQFPNDNS